MTMDTTTADHINNGTTVDEEYSAGGSVIGSVAAVFFMIFVTCCMFSFFKRGGSDTCKCINETIECCCTGLHDCVREACRSCRRICDRCESRFRDIDLPSCSECSAPECIPMSLCRERQTTDQDPGTGQQRHQTEMGPSAPSFSDLNEENHTSITLQDERFDPPPEPSAPPPSDPLAPPPSYENVMANNQYVAPPALPEDPVPPPPSYKEQRREKEFYEKHERETGEQIMPKLQLPPSPPKTPPPRTDQPPLPSEVMKMRKEREIQSGQYHSQFVSLYLQQTMEEEHLDQDFELDNKYVRVTQRATVGHVGSFVQKKLLLGNFYHVDIFHPTEVETYGVIEATTTLQQIRDDNYGGQDCIIELHYRITPKDSDGVEGSET